MCAVTRPPVFQVYLEPDFFQSSVPVAFWVVSASPKFNTTRCSCPHHQLGEVTVPTRRGTVGVGHASQQKLCVWCGGAVCLRAAVALLCSGLWRVAFGKPSIG